MNSPFLRKGRGHLLSNKQQEGACSRSIMAARIFLFFCLLAILQRSSSSLCSLQYRGQPPPRGWRQVSPAANGPAAFSLRPSQACKARAARAYQQYIPRLGACHGTKAGSRGLGHAGLNGLYGLQCLCAPAAAATLPPPPQITLCTVVELLSSLSDLVFGILGSEERHFT